jgi:ferritin-like metal-binding protein YciE
MEKEGSSASDKAKSFRELFLDELKDIYWAEQALMKALPKIRENASSEELFTAIDEHIVETENQVTRLQEAFVLLDEKASGKKCEAMEGLIKEAEEMMQETEKGSLRDAAIISCGLKIEHYEIASYGTLIAFAKVLGEKEVVDLLTQTLIEEKEADETLTLIAESALNLEAAEEGEEE